MPYPHTGATSTMLSSRAEVRTGVTSPWPVVERPVEYQDASSTLTEPSAVSVQPPRSTTTTATSTTL